MDHQPRPSARCLLALACALLSWGIAGLAAAQVAPSPEHPIQPPPIAAGRCLNCHVARPGQDDLFVTRDGFCQPIAAETWHQQDKHHDALYLLLTPANLALTERILGFPITDVLRYELDPANSYGQRVKNARLVANADAARLHTVRQCLACHSPVEQPVEAGGEALAAVESGVSCQACHGNGLQYEIPHQFPVWRIVDAEVKSYRYGLADLRNPWVRSRLCASCHVGSPPTKNRPARFVRHEWYANGHPPLPGLEPATFATQQPPHWRRIQEKLLPAAGQPPGFQYFATSPAEAEIPSILLTELRPYMRASFLAANANSLPAGSAAAPDAASARRLLQADLARTKDVLIGGLATSAAYAQLIASAPPEIQQDFAIFDCQACHHELRSQFPSERQARRQVLAGRPPPAAWTFVLSRAAAGYAGQHDDRFRSGLETATQELNAAFSARPFGDPVAAQVAAAKLAAICEQMGRGLTTTTIDAAAARYAVGELADVHNDPADPRHGLYRDYHSSRQAAWAIRELLHDLAGTPYSPNGAPLQNSVPEDVLAALGARSPLNQAETGQRIREMFGGGPWLGPLRLQLPAGQDQSVVEQLPAWLKSIADYDPAAWEASLEPVSRAFPKPN